VCVIKAKNEALKYFLLLFHITRIKQTSSQSSLNKIKAFYFRVVRWIGQCMVEMLEQLYVDYHVKYPLRLSVFN
jgi:hypothetical protein